MDPLWLYAGFAGFILLMLALDLGVFHRDQNVIGMREALGWSGFWIGLALVFNLLLWQFPGFFFAHQTLPAGVTLDQLGAVKGLEFLAGYLVEKALSVDNLFVIALIFGAFAVPAAYQHRVLFYGILGAIVLRTIFIFAGVGLMHAFHWIIYVFGALLIITGIKMALAKGAPPADPAQHWFVRRIRRVVPVTDRFAGQRFFTRIPGPGGRTVLAATPLFLALVLVEFTDLVFAVDSIPAILALTSDPFIVLTSNIFAILGLRSLYFALAGLLDRFHYLSYALAGILVFVGVKMLLVDWYKIPVGISLAVIALALVAGVVGSLLHPRTPSAVPATT
jgi:tellurite resistance protein TerC